MQRSDGLRLALVAAFIASLVTAQFLAVKIVQISMPISIFLVGETILVPAGVVAIGITFLTTDCYTELYGRHAAHRLVNVGFGVLALVLGLLWLAIAFPGSPQGVDPDLFATVLAPSTNIVVGGLLAYIVSQHWDVFVFQHIREFTETRHLWIRNLGSTGTSQAIDTMIFILTAFWLAPHLFGVGEALPLIALLSLLVGQYLAKLAIAAIDTPFVYLIVGYARRRDRTAQTVAPD